MRRRIFEIFAQVEEHRNHTGGGLGIGLALVQQLVRLHDGIVDVESAGEGKGSRFAVRFPAMTPADKPTS